MPLISGLMDHFSKRNILFFSFLGFALFVMFLFMVHMPAKARERIQSMLIEAGFDDAQIGDVKINTDGFFIQDIRLDSYGLDGIKTLNAHLNWVSFLLTGSLKSVEIQNAIISLDSKSLPRTAEKLLGNLLKLPPYKIDISNVIIDMATNFGNIRIQLETHINHKNETNGRDIKARVYSAQYQLGFESLWEGTLSDDGVLDLFAEIEDGRLNVGPAQVSRFYGWAGVSVSNGGYSVQSQLEAGSARLDTLPLQKLTFINDHKKGDSTVVFRAGVSGLPDVIISSDYIFKEGQERSITSLKGKNLGSLIARTLPDDKTIKSPFAKIGEYELNLVYEPEKRFTGGPLPFAISFQEDGRKKLNGHVLFYPDKADLRGSLETNEEYTTAISSLLNIPKEDVNGSFIRIEKNMAGLLKKTDETKQPQKKF